MRNTMRIVEFDILKGFAIFAVIYTHCMQYLFDSSFDNPVYNFIYSFHMPLFIIISGILSFRKITEKGRYSLPVKRLPILVPAFVFGGMLIGIRLILGKSVGMSDLVHLPFTFWFLSSLFVCTCVYWLATLFCKKQLFNLVLLSAVSLLLPIGEYNKFMIPFFGIGLCLAQYDALSYIRRISTSRIWLLIILLGIAYMFLWSSDYTIYKSSCPSVLMHESKQIVAYLLRIVFGLGFSMVLLALSFQIKLNSSVISVLSYLSRCSLELYVLHLFVLILFYGSGLVLDGVVNSTFSITTLSFIIAVIFTIALSYILKFVGKNRVLSTVLFGRHYA